MSERADGIGGHRLFHDRRNEGRRHAPYHPPPLTSTAPMEVSWITQHQGKVNYPTLEGDIGEYHRGEHLITEGLEKPGRTRFHIGES